jgi:predicted phage-related endonuclease
MPIDYATAIGQVRALIPDVDEPNLLLADPQIAAFLAMEGDNVKLATAQALDVIASSEALVSKKIRTQEGLTTDGPAVAKELRARASELRRQVGEDDGDAFDIVDFVDPFSRLGAELAEG